MKKMKNPSLFFNYLVLKELCIDKERCFYKLSDSVLEGIYPL